MSLKVNIVKFWCLLTLLECSLVKANTKCIMWRNCSIKIAYFFQHLNAKIFYEMAENVNLKAQLGENGVPPQVAPPPECIPSSSYGFHCTTLYDEATMITSGIGSHSKVETATVAPMTKSSKKVENKKS